MVFVPYNQTPEVLKPGEQALYLPSAPVASKFPAVLGFRFFAPFTMRRNHFNAAFIKELIVKCIAIVGFITNQFIRRILGKAAVYCVSNKLYLMGEALST